MRYLVHLECVTVVHFSWSLGYQWKAVTHKEGAAVGEWYELLGSGVRLLCCGQKAFGGLLSEELLHMKPCLEILVWPPCGILSLETS